MFLLSQVLQGIYSKCVLEVEEAVSVVSFISSSPGYIVNESNEQSLDY
jgi:hypothetical protein